MANVNRRQTSERSFRRRRPTAALPGQQVLTVRPLCSGRATRPLIFMRALSVVYAALCVAWVRHSLCRSNFMELLSGWSVLEDKTTCFTAAIAVLSIVIGAECLLRDGRRSGEGVPST